MEELHRCCNSEFFFSIAAVAMLVLIAGMMSGLTLGLMSMSIVDLEVLAKSGKPKDRLNAAKILPVVRTQHLLLCTLLISNAGAMEALPIFLDNLVPEWSAILLSVTLILLFGEIIPQSVCSRYGLVIGAAVAPTVQVLVWFWFPITYPLSKVKNLVTLNPTDEMHVKNAVIRRIPRKRTSSLSNDVKDVRVEIPGDNFTRKQHVKMKRSLRKPNLSSGAIVSRRESPMRPNLSSGGIVYRRESLKSKRWSEEYHPDVLTLDESSLSTFPDEEEVVGIITMEDVIIELLKEEISEETDDHHIETC